MKRQIACFADLRGKGIDLLAQVLGRVIFHCIEPLCLCCQGAHEGVGVDILHKFAGYCLIHIFHPQPASLCLSQCFQPVMAFPIPEPVAPVRSLQKACQQVA
ncbi:hypothetical protein [Thiohalobacter thiocyanaticus]|uniref:hypothetical protein n=1 Tax=Thiohalobacter thiocyanaticus TaxID=585455 RepID=UPI0012FE1683|nr:hypothetical protein [Thiohalobacter thiocyanaticus]